jgi:hypothetical protein
MSDRAHYTRPPRASCLTRLARVSPRRALTSRLPLHDAHRQHAFRAGPQLAAAKCAPSPPPPTTRFTRPENEGASNLYPLWHVEVSRTEQTGQRLRCNANRAARAARAEPSTLNPYTRLSQ